MSSLVETVVKAGGGQLTLLLNAEDVAKYEAAGLVVKPTKPRAKSKTV